MPETSDQVLEHAQRFGWNLAEITLVVEGELDVAYFEHANSFYLKASGQSLLSTKFGVTACGKGNEGGTRALIERFSFMHQLARFAWDDPTKKRYRLIALVDYDDPGRSTCSVVRTFNRNIIECQDLFVLRRVYPLEQLDPKELKARIEAANSAWNGIDCEMEDLLERSLLDSFVSNAPQCLRRPVMEKSGEFHFDFRREFKPRLLQYVTANADAEKLTRILGVLKALRFYAGLSISGNDS